MLYLANARLVFESENGNEERNIPESYHSMDPFDDLNFKISYKDARRPDDILTDRYKIIGGRSNTNDWDFKGILKK